MILFTKDHKEIVGSVDGEPFRALFDEDGYAEVDEAVGEQLLQLHAAIPVEEPTLDSADQKAELEKMNVLQLKKYARENSIDLGEAAKKIEILEVIHSTLSSVNTQENHE